MSQLSFASIFKLLSEEFGTHSKDDGEVVLESLNKEKLKKRLQIMYHRRISNVSTRKQKLIMMNVNSLTNLKKAFLIQKNWFVIRLRVRK